MRRIDRTNVHEPDSLAMPSDAVIAEKSAAHLYYQTYDPLVEGTKGFNFKEYKNYDVQHQLRALFHNKCAYCESDLGDDLEVEHFRPKGRVTEDQTHIGYWWLAHTWTNLLPSCKPCNQKRRQHIVTEATTVEELTTLLAKRAKISYGKANHFPIAGVRAKSSVDSLTAEQPNLVDPASEDPALYLRWSTSGHYSVVVPRSNDPVAIVRASSTISVFALNRANLVKSRTRVLTFLRFEAEKMFENLERDMAEGGSQIYVDRALERIASMRQLQEPNQPYSAMVREFVDDVVAQLQKRVAEGVGPALFCAPPGGAENT